MLHIYNQNKPEQKQKVQSLVEVFQEQKWIMI